MLSTTHASLYHAVSLPLPSLGTRLGVYFTYFSLFCVCRSDLQSAFLECGILSALSVSFTLLCHLLYHLLSDIDRSERNCCHPHTVQPYSWLTYDIIMTSLLIVWHHLFWHDITANCATLLIIGVVESSSRPLPPSSQDQRSHTGHPQVSKYSHTRASECGTPVARNWEWAWKQVHMWQSRIEIEYYSVTYFKRITNFDAL